MPWITPKTNWISTDYFNLTDYQRITNNIAFIKTEASKLYNIPVIPTMPVYTIESIPSAQGINTLEDSIEIIRSNSYGDLFRKTTWVSGQLGPSYEDWNRIEKELKSLNTLFISISKYIPTLSFTLGGGDFE